METYNTMYFGGFNTVNGKYCCNTLQDVVTIGWNADKFQYRKR